MAKLGLLLASLLLLSCFAEISFGSGLFSSLKRTLVVTASPKEGQVLKAGEDEITVKWSPNKTFPAGTDSANKTIKVKLCCAPISQVDRAFLKDELSKYKTCQLKIVSPITGRHTTLYLCSICFSAFSIVSLLVFFLVERRKAKLSQQK